MPSRSWTTARITVVFLAALGAGGLAHAEIDPVTNTVNLELNLVGAGAEGYEIVVKPGHAACKFKAIAVQVPKGREGRPLRFKPFDVTSTSADRDCSFEIILREPGKPERTCRRGLRLDQPDAKQAQPSQDLTYYISAQSMSARKATPAKPKLK